jgi:hypothetical protein
MTTLRSAAGEAEGGAFWEASSGISVPRIPGRNFENETSARLSESPHPPGSTFPNVYRTF